jgi:hypothetical protein
MRDSIESRCSIESPPLSKLRSRACARDFAPANVQRCVGCGLVAVGDDSNMSGSSSSQASRAIQRRSAARASNPVQGRQLVRCLLHVILEGRDPLRRMRLRSGGPCQLCGSPDTDLPPCQKRRASNTAGRRLRGSDGSSGCPTPLGLCRTTRSYRNACRPARCREPSPLRHHTTGKPRSRPRSAAAAPRLPCRH